MSALTNHTSAPEANPCPPNLLATRHGQAQEAREKDTNLALRADMVCAEAQLADLIALVNICPPDLNRRGWRAARNGERAFIGIAALAGGGFTFAMLELPLPWYVALPLIIALWVGVSWALTVALRTGVQIALAVEAAHQKGQDRAAQLCRGAFAVFLLSFALNVASRLLPIPPAVFGVTAVAIELSALMCAASLGAIAYAKGHLVELFEHIYQLQRASNIIRGQLGLPMSHLRQFAVPALPSDSFAN